MKKILLIMAGDFHYKGGIENYNLLLFNLLFKHYQDFQIDVVLPCCKYVPEKLENANVNFIFYRFSKIYNTKNSFLNRVLNFIHDLKNINSTKVFVKKNKDKYNLILNSSLICFHSCKNNSNYFLIQHVNIDAYMYKLSCKNNKSKLTTLIGRILYGSFNFLKYSRNFIVYDKFVKDQISVYAPLTNITDISLPSKITPILPSEITSEGRQKIVFLGRIAVQKNIEALIEIDKKINLIEFYGGAESEIELKYKAILEQNHWYKGIAKNEQQIKDILLKYKFLIIYSTFEGFSFSLVEALSQGVPIIVKNTYTSAHFLCNNKTGLLLPKNNSVAQDIDLIKKFISMSETKYHDYQLNCLKFYNQNLSLDLFNKKWMKIFDEYLTKK